MQLGIVVERQETALNYSNKTKNNFEQLKDSSKTKRLEQKKIVKKAGTAVKYSKTAENNNETASFSCDLPAFGHKQLENNFLRSSKQPSTTCTGQRQPSDN